MGDRKEASLAPHDTDIEKQKRRHGPPLLVLAIVVGLVFIGFFVWIGTVMDGADEPAIDVPEAAQAPAG